MEGFSMPNLDKVIVNNQRDGYNINIHYKYFNCKKITNNVKSFIKWACDVLFINQLGSRRKNN